MNADTALELLSTPVWVVLPEAPEVLFANGAARELSGGQDLTALRRGSLSACAEELLTGYLPALRANEQVVEIWTVQRDGRTVPQGCRLSLMKVEGQRDAILIEGLLSGLPVMAPRATPAVEAQPCVHECRFYEALFHTNSAPMLLIDPNQDGRIVDANLAATQFYGYSRETFCQKHTWEINSLGREVVPVMNEVAKLPGGHKPLNFVHRLADGSLRDVQTYAGPLEINGKRMMLGIIHDVTEQKRLKNELERAASLDPLTGLWNRRQFLNFLEDSHKQKRRHDLDYSLMLLDVDHFKAINDQYGHAVGDEVLVTLAKAFEARVRETDIVCRWGGEEFIILLPQTDREHAGHLAESLRDAIEHIRVSGLPTVTVSIGVAQYEDHESTGDLLKRADAALYQAKALGRNGVVSF